MEARRKGQSIMEAATTGAKERFRAVMMTSFAFVLGLAAYDLVRLPKLLAGASP